MKTLFAKVTELRGEGWHVSFPGGGSLTKETAGDALNAIREYGADIAVDGHSNAIVVTWEAVSAMGMLVVKAVTS